ncbi:MAG TPA: D-amino acid aminotransferase [Burkholderiales bacterium]|nr:D-amino acid aminotransferase [Burkholderiales bacterium]
MGETVYLNGRFMAPEEAHVPVLDRGFIFGDAVYEVIPVYSRVLLRLDEHLARLQYSLDSIRLRNPHSVDEWRSLLQEVVMRNPWDDQGVYLQVTRGVARRDQAFPDPAVVKPTVFAMANDMRPPSAEQRRDGVPVITREDYRWLRCDIKATSLIANCLLRQEAVDVGCAEVILLRNGKVTEGSASNVFLVKDGIITTPPKDNLILPGITYDLVLELARRHDLPFEVRELTVGELYAADEAWLSSSLREVLPIASVDGIAIGNGKPGPVYERMYALYQAYKREVIDHAGTART